MVATIAAVVTKRHRSAETITNKVSSGAHVVLHLEDQVNEPLSGILIDIACLKRFENMAQLEHRMGKDSMTSGTNNIIIRKHLEAISTGWDGKVLRYSSKLSNVLVAALGDRQAITFRVVLCGDGSSNDISSKRMAMVSEFHL